MHYETWPCFRNYPLFLKILCICCSHLQVQSCTCWATFAVEHKWKLVLGQAIWVHSSLPFHFTESWPLCVFIRGRRCHSPKKWCKSELELFSISGSFIDFIRQTWSDKQGSVLHEHARPLTCQRARDQWQRPCCIVIGTKLFTLKACLRLKW